MLELGMDQADGLKQLFLPSLRGRINVIGVSSDSEPGRLAAGIGQAMIEHGYDVRWEDPLHVLPPNLPMSEDATQPAQITVVATNQPEQAPSADQTVCSIFAARPHPAELRKLYASMKQATSVERSAPFTVLWCGKGTEDPQMRRLCESNLSDTVSRFLGAPVEFIDSPRGAPRDSRILSSAVNEAHFLERLSSMLLNRLGYVRQPASTLQN